MYLHKFHYATAAVAAVLLNTASPAFSFSFSPSPSLNHQLARPRAVAEQTSTYSQRNGSFKKSSSLFMSDTAAIEADDKDPPLFEGLLKGITRDYKMRLPLYKSDITDGLNTQCLAAICFLFFACLSPAIGFGSLFGAVTNGAIGTMEMVSSTAMSLTIIGSTGPVLAFVAALVQLADKMGLPFLPLYAWTGIWTSAILFLSSITSASNLVKYLTRFTDEIFSTLISFIFVVERAEHCRSFTNPASTFTKGLMTLIVAVSTYVTANTLRGLRNTVTLHKVVIANWAKVSQGAAATLPSLAIPPTFATTSGRPWLIPIMDLPVWARWGAFLPALMATVLLFLDQNITVRLVNNPQYKMEKGRRKNNMLDGMHADLLVISILTFITSIIGLPWLVAATVRSISHVRALSIFDSAGKLKSTIEQRITGLSIHSLIGACVLFDKPRAILTQIPKSVLMGLFLFLGTSALPGNEMWERMKELFKDSKIAPKERWSKVPTKVTMLFTAIQMGCLGAMVYVKESPIGVLFPVVIAMLAPLRFWLEKSGVVKKEYMDILDEE
ncbi:bicarbonate transporter [Skeletonema marinoi]|uniref:Bicarbonate transporter n=1 Tax=Skeletonema marinoi TaxID=267567 RepID=A0AAD9DGB3_9STRA|nr:bicarbonate transporter [Skeletonema marinoi]